MNFYDKFDDTRGQNGIGTQLNIWDDTLKKYRLFMPLESVPAVVGSTESVEVDLLTSSMKTKIKGKTSVDDKDVEFLWHRDNLRILRNAVGKQLKFLVSYPDFTGWMFEGEIVYRPNDATSDKLVGTFTIIANKVDDRETEDVRDMLARTCFITSLVPSTIDLSSGKTITIDLTASSDTATFTAESNNDSITASVSGKVLTISGTDSGNAIVTIKASASEMASWETTTAVTVA